MKAREIILLGIFSSIFQQIFCQSENMNKFILQSSLVYHSCQNDDLPNNIIGKNLVPDQSAIITNTLKIQGWFILRSTDGFDRTLISLHYKINTILVDLYYNYDKNQIFFKVNEKNVYFCSLIKNQWLFVSIQLNIDTNNDKLNYAISILSNTQEPHYSKSQVSLNNINLNLMDLIINIGSPGLYLKVKSSCAFSKDVRMYQNYPFFFFILNQLTNDNTSIETQLYYYFEFYSIALTPGILQSQGIKRSYAKIQNSLQKTNNFNNEKMYLPIFNLDEIGSFILSFDAKVIGIQSDPDGICKIAQIELISLENNSAQQMLEFQLNSLNQISLGGQSILLQYDITKYWTQINLKINKLLISNFYYWVNDNYTAYLKNLLTNDFSLVKITFGSEMNNCQIQLNNIKLYQGDQIQKNNTCITQVGEDKQECLRCKQGFLLDQSDQNMSCTNITVDNKSEIDYIFKQEIFECPKDMYFFKQKCQCVKGFYLENKNCKRCPKHCLDCIDAKSCNKDLYHRNQQGQCFNNTFDDGFSCIQPKRAFDFKDTIVLPFPQKNNDQIFKFDQIQTLGEFKKLFYSFNIQINNIDGQLFSVFRDGKQEIFSFYFETNLNTKTFYVKIFSNQQEKIKMEVQSKIIWIGVWTDSRTHKFFLHNNGQTIYKEYTEDLKINLISPSIEVGPCIQFDSLSYSCNHFQSNLLVVNGMEDPISYGISNIFQYHSQDQQIIAKYVYDEKQNSKANILDKISNYTMNLNKPLQSHKIKGIGFTHQGYGVINNFGYLKGLMTFSSSIQIEFIENQSLLLMYQIGAQICVRYYLYPEEFGLYASIRICINNTCRDAKYIKIEVAVPSSLIIIPKNIAPYESEIKYIEFDIISNYQQETISILSITGLELNKNILNIQLSQIQSFQYLIFLNHIKFYLSGHFYYIDYRESDNCFVYMNINPKICIKPKSGYCTYGNQTISYQQCYDMNEEYFQIVNPYSQECEITNIKQNRCKEIEFNGQSYYCKKCKDPFAIVNSGLEISIICKECKDGYFFSQTLDKCQICHSKCKRCTQNFDNCIECVQDGQLTPSCQCIQPNYYLGTDYKCYKCEDKCQQCIEQSSNCIQCQENRIYPPYCICKPGYQQIGSNECEKIICDKKCLTCIDSSSNCDICANGRIESPDCKCEKNYFENKETGNCQICPSSTYLNTSSLLCQPCSITCAECEDTEAKCTACIGLFLLRGNTCVCQSDTVPYVNKKGEQKCLDHMFMDLEIRFFQNQYSLIFIFDEELQDIDFQKYKIKDILSIYLTQTPKDTYEITNPKINGKEFSVDIRVLKNISTQQGNALFQTNQIFISKSELYAMNQIYTQVPINFNIGPFIFSEETLTNKQADQIKNTIDKIDPNVLEFIQKFQFVFYILNTLQPSITFFLLNLNFPPNLYKFYQIIGSFIFSSIPNYQSHIKQQEYNIFSYRFDKNQVQSANLFSFYGFSDSLIVNIPIILIKFGIIFLGLFVSLILTDITLNQKHIKVGQQLKKILFQQLDTEIEVNLLSTSLSLLIQFGSVNQNAFMNRMSVYLSVIVILILLGSLIFNIQQVNQEKQSQYSVILTKRLKSRVGKFERNYFIFQLIKKYSVVILVFALQSFPLHTCVFNGVIFLISSISTLLLKPYLLLAQRIIKIVGDFLLSILWFFHIYIIYLEANLNQNNVIENEQISSYLLAGNVVIIVLMVYNFIYLIEFLIRIIKKIKEFIKPTYNKEDRLQQNQIITPQCSNPINQQKLYKKKNVKGCRLIKTKQNQKERIQI